jgi:hypothetical protein
VTGFVAPTVPSVGDGVTAAQGAVVANDLNSGPNMGTPTSIGAAGTSAVSAEVRDAVLGNYSFTAVAGRRYLAVMNGLGLSGTAGQLGHARIRNGGALTPTIASPLIADSQIYVPATGGTGQQTYPLGATFVPGAGPVTLSMFTVGLAGGLTPVFARELYAVDMGPA